MKRSLVFGLAALALLLVNRQEASAWSKFTFGIGMNISCEKENTCFLWGLCKSGPRCCGGVDGDFCPPAGCEQGQQFGVPASAAAAAGVPAQVPQVKGVQAAQPVSYNYYNQYTNPYANNGYAAPQQGYYPYGNNNYGYSQYAVPSYWGGGW